MCFQLCLLSTKFCFSTASTNDNTDTIQADVLSMCYLPHRYIIWIWTQKQLNIVTFPLKNVKRKKKNPNTKLMFSMLLPGPDLWVPLRFPIGCQCSCVISHWLCQWNQWMLSEAYISWLKLHFFCLLCWSWDSWSYVCFPLSVCGNKTFQTDSISLPAFLFLVMLHFFTP